MVREYLIILIFMVIAAAVAVVLYFFSYFLVEKQLEVEKISAYECGFDPFEDSRGHFDVKFYLVSILFVIFDLEISFLFPWSLVLGSIDLFGWLVMICFLGVLTLGFVYEWKKGALEW